MSEQIEQRNTSSPKLVKDITPGAKSSNFGALSEFNDKLYFFLEKKNNLTDTSTHELWTSNGTATSTKSLKSLGNFEPDFIYTWLEDTQFYFTARKDDGDNSTPDPQQLWVSDGTTTGTKLLKDLGRSFGYTNLTEFNDQIYFTISEYNNTTQTTSYELWKTNGTSTGTKLVKNLGESQPSIFAVTEDSLYFSTYSFDNNTFTPSYDLWKTNGTATGTKLLKDTGDVFPSLAEFNDEVYFNIGQFSNTTFETTSQLWKTDGTNIGTKQLKKLGESQFNGFYNWLDEDTLYFTTSRLDSKTFRTNYNLWKTNGTPTSTQLLKELGDKFSIIAEFKDTVYFSAIQDGKNQLWKTNGTQTGTKLVKTFGGYQVNNLYNWFDEDTLYFTTVKDDAKPNTPDPYQLWKTDGTAAGTQLIKDLGKSSPLGIDVTEFNDTIYFTTSQYNSTTDTTTYQLWKTDGTATATKKVKDLGTSQVDNFFGWLDDNTLYFTTVKDDGKPATADVYELWKTNGTATGTQKIQNLGQLPFLNWGVVDSDFYYTAKDAKHGLELWKLEGSNDVVQRSVQTDELLNSNTLDPADLLNADDSLLISKLGINPALIPPLQNPLEVSLMGQSHGLTDAQQGLGLSSENTLFPLPENS